MSELVSAAPRLVAAIVALAVSAPALASISSVVPDIVLSTPASVVLNATESDTDILGFDEQQCIVLDYDLMTDQGRVQEQTAFSCHFFHADPETTATLVGRATFDNVILGVISTSAELDASDDPCGLSNVAYPVAGTEQYRGLEGFQGSTEGYGVSADHYSIEIRTDIPSWSDQVRVITACDEE